MTFSNVKSKQKLKIQLESKQDGIYIVVNNPTGQPVSHADVSSVLSDNLVPDVDFEALQSIFGSNDPHLSVKISNAMLPAVDEDIRLEISSDKMAVTASFVKPVGGGKTLTAEEIRSKLNEMGVVLGVLNDVIALLVTNKNYAKSYIVAKGKMPKDDVDGKLVFSFDINKSSHKPKLKEDGTADFRNIGMFKLAMKGQLLVSVVDMIEGEDGYNVLGAVIQRRKGKKAPALPKGKNVISDAENKRLFAEINGQILYTSGRVSVFPVLEITGNVDNKTGNIDFNGSIIVKGDILTGFRVVASGNIDVLGIIEGAYVQSGGGLHCVGGILGMNKAEIIVAGSVVSKNVNNCELQAGGSIITDQILHSKVMAEGSIEASTGKGFIVGGKIVSTDTISCKIVGSSMATATAIEIGASQAKIAEYNALVAEMTKAKSEYKKVEEAINSAVQSMTINKPTQEKKMLLAKLEDLKEQKTMELEELKIQIEELMPQVNNNSGFLRVADRIHPGVNITIGNAGMIVRDDIRHAKLYNDKAKIIIGLY